MDLLEIVATIFSVIMIIMAVLVPFFIYKIRNEIVDINRKITKYLESRK